jgi:hypothetical protein
LFAADYNPKKYSRPRQRGIFGYKRNIERMKNIVTQTSTEIHRVVCKINLSESPCLLWVLRETMQPTGKKKRVLL